MTPFSKNYIFSIALFIVTLICAPVAQALTADADAGMVEAQKPERTPLSPDAALQKRMNIAGRQRLLSQRLVSTGCFLSLDANSEANRRILTETIDSYRIALQMLRDGNVPYRLPAETDPATLIALEKAEEAWLTHQDFFESWLTHTPTAVEMRDAQMKSRDLLNTSKDVALALIAHQNMSEHQIEYLRIIDIAGRQRMLAQRAVKDTCLASAKHATANERLSRHRTVATTLAAFEISARSLSEGNKMMRVVQTPNQDALWGVEASAAAWDEMRWILRNSIAGARLDQSELTMLSQKFEALLPILDDTVWFYSKL